MLYDILFDFGLLVIMWSKLFFFNVHFRFCADIFTILPVDLMPNIIGQGQGWFCPWLQHLSLLSAITFYWISLFLTTYTWEWSHKTLIKVFVSKERLKFVDLRNISTGFVYLKNLASSQSPTIKRGHSKEEEFDLSLSHPALFSVCSQNRLTRLDWWDHVRIIYFTSMLERNFPKSGYPVTSLS